MPEGAPTEQNSKKLLKGDLIVSAREKLIPDPVLIPDLELVRPQAFRFLSSWSLPDVGVQELVHVPLVFLVGMQRRLISHPLSDKVRNFTDNSQLTLLKTES